MKKLYIAGAYSADTREGIAANVEHARAAMIDLLGRGYAVYCPHTQTEGLELVFVKEVFMENDFEWIRNCNGIYMLKGWEDSIGACEERELALLIQRADPEFAVYYEGSEEPECLVS